MTETPGHGHNSQDVDTDAIAIVNLSRIRKAQDESNSCNGSLRSAFAKAEMQGMHLKAAKRALSVARSEKTADLIEEMRMTLLYLKLMGKGASSEQIDMFEFDSGLAPVDEQAANEGRRAGLSGETAVTNPHDLNSKAGRAWEAAYTQGVKERELVMAMAENGDEEDAEDGGDADPEFREVGE